MKITVNDMCRVKLTAYGVKILKARRGYMLTLPCWNATRSELTTELWTLMAVFGDCLYMGNTQIPFVRNNIDLYE